MAHFWGVVGLGLNMLGTLLLLWFPPAVQGIAADGSPIVAWMSELPKDDDERRRGKRRYLWRQWLFRTALGLLVIGFALQLVDLVTT